MRPDDALMDAILQLFSVFFLFRMVLMLKLSCTLCEREKDWRRRERREKKSSEVLQQCLYSWLQKKSCSLHRKLRVMIPDRSCKCCSKLPPRAGYTAAVLGEWEKLMNHKRDQILFMFCRRAHTDCSATSALCLIWSRNFVWFLAFDVKPGRRSFHFMSKPVRKHKHFFFLSLSPRKVWFSYSLT